MGILLLRFEEQARYVTAVRIIEAFLLGVGLVVLAANSGMA